MPPKPELDQPTATLTPEKKTPTESEGSEGNYVFEESTNKSDLTSVEVSSLPEKASTPPPPEPQTLVASPIQEDLRRPGLLQRDTSNTVAPNNQSEDDGGEGLSKFPTASVQPLTNGQMIANSHAF